MEKCSLLLLVFVIFAADASLPLVRLEIKLFPINFTSTTEFREDYYVTADKIGIPGRPFDLHLDFHAEQFCVNVPSYIYSNSRYNDTDVVYAPHTAFRLPILDAVPNCTTSVWAMGPGSDIWQIFKLATLTLNFDKSAHGQLILGERYEQAFDDMYAPRLLIPCENFPDRCWLSGSILGQTSRVFFTPGAFHIRLGSAIWNLYVQNPTNIIHLTMGTWQFQFATQTMLSTTPGPTLAELLSPFAFSTPDWASLPRSVVQQCPECVLPTDIIFGSTLVNVAIIFDSQNQRLEIGNAYESSRWTIWNSLFTFLLMILMLHCYLNSLMRLPSFLSHEYDPLADSITGSLHAPNDLYKSELRRIFVPFTYVPELVGVALVITVLVVNAMSLNFSRRLQFFVMAPFSNESVTNISLGEDVLYLLLTLTLASLFTIHVYFWVITPPGNCIHNRWLSPSLIVLMRRFVYESELAIAIWITLVEGPLRTYYSLLIFTAALFFIYSDTSALLTYFFHLAVTRNWFITVMLSLVYAEKVFLVVIYMLFPIVASIWPRNDQPSTCILTAIAIFLFVLFAATVEQYVTLQREIDRVKDEYRKKENEHDISMTETGLHFNFS